jgi:hypothetical protein
MAETVALGFKLHTGWAVLVAVAGEVGRFEVRLRCRIELLPSGDSVSRFVYHEAAKLPESQTSEFVQRAEAASQETARVAVKSVLEHLRSVDLAVKAAGIPSGSKPIPKDLSAVLRSHPLIHSAEGALFRQAIASACVGCGLAVISVREREVWLNAATTWGLKETELRKQVDGLRKSVGAPWGMDQKIASAVAIFALRSRSVP